MQKKSYKMYNTCRIMEVKKQTINTSVTCCGIKGGRAFERVPGIGYYNGYGGFTTYGEKFNTIELKIFIYPNQWDFKQNPNAKGWVQYIELRDDILKRYDDVKKIDNKVAKLFTKKLKGKKIRVVWSMEKSSWVPYRMQDLWDLVEN